MKAIAVIGANYGDEGKGLTIDYLAREQAAKGQRPLIARFNGGAQAGHTVVTPDGAKHVFHHVGAGSFVLGARTYLSSKFIVNPYVLGKELNELSQHIGTPVLLAHPQCYVTTIFDMALNSLAELSRGQERHGSCGMGVNETVTRNLARPAYQLKLTNVAKQAPEELAALLELIVTDWVPIRLETLGLTRADVAKHDVYASVLDAKNIDFLAVALQLKELIKPLIILDKESLADLLLSLEPTQEVLLEGAQGLALDEQLGAFPYVTRSITGLPAAAAVAAFELGALDIQPLYVTRAYLTRHGAGPMPFEGEPITDKLLSDATNVENQWQGKLRYAPLNIQQLKTMITADLLRTSETSPAVTMKGATIARLKLMVTCLDQLGTTVNYVTEDGSMTTASTDNFLIMLARELGREVELSYVSFGPTARHVKAWL